MRLINISCALGLTSLLALAAGITLVAGITAAPAFADPSANSEIKSEAKQEKKLEEEVDLNDYRILTTPDPAVKAETPKAIKSSTQEKSKSASSMQKAGKILTAPMAFGGVLMGMTVGVPVRIARDVSHETLRMRDQMTDDVAGGDKPDLFARTVGSYTGMAYGVVSGVIKGSIKGTERAIDCGARKPFSKESISLQDPN
ncbi:hypothetical protein BH11CYA1_BH11CYA1_15670 [soil metagenome]